MALLGQGLAELNPRDGLSVFEANLALLQRFWPNMKDSILVAQTSIGLCHQSLGRHDEALRLCRKTYASSVKLYGSDDARTILEGNNVCLSLVRNKLFAEGKQFARKMRRTARQVLGDHHNQSLVADVTLAEALFYDPTSVRADLLEAEAILKDTVKIARRILGPQHPNTMIMAGQLTAVQQALARGARPIT